MRVIVTGGGTGGHIYPAIAIADKIKEMEPEAEILYVGSPVGLEKEIVPKAGYPIELVTAMWLDRSNILKIFKTGYGVIKGTMEAGRLMKKFKPDVVLGTGGYVCVPVLLAGCRYKAKTFLHEQNAFPGLANRYLEKYVNKVFLGFPDGAKYFRQPQKLINAGNPVRSSFFTMTKEAARKDLGLGADDFVVLSFGGSLGAEKINQVAFDLMEKINGREDMTLIFGTGKEYYGQILQRIKEKQIKVSDNIKIKDYIDNMDKYLVACDLVICRSGALSVAEATACGKAAILIPSPNVTGNHQYYNAKAVADKGGAILMEEENLTSDEVISRIMELKDNPNALEQMSRASRSCAPDKALDIIYETIKG